MKRTAKSKSKPKAEPQATLVVFLLDRSGSMQLGKSEAISGFNSCVEELRKKDLPGMRFTFIQFDSQSIDSVHEAVPLKEVALLNDSSYRPRAWTPLLDATAKTIQVTRLKADKSKVLFVTLTDGQENASTEYSRESLTKLIKEMEDKSHWTFVHIGVGKEGWTELAKTYAGTQSVSNVLPTSHGNLKRSFSRITAQTVSYASDQSTGAATVQNFWKGAKDSEDVV